MPAPSFCVFDGGTGEDGPELPRRPSTDDLGGDEKKDNNENPPDDVEHYTAAGWNQKVKVEERLARVSASCKLDVRFSAGAPFINSAPALPNAVVLATFTVTDLGTGYTRVVWPADTFPPFVCRPTGLTLFSSSSSVVAGHCNEITNGIEVRTFVGGVATDVPWTITLN